MEKEEKEKLLALAKRLSDRALRETKRSIASGDPRNEIWGQGLNWASHRIKALVKKFADTPEPKAKK